MKKVLFVIAAVAIISCQNQDQVANSVSDSNDTIILTPETEVEDFNVFWKQFREAILQNDSVKLLESVNFPLKAHGELDEDPHLVIDQKTFYKYFKICLDEHDACLDAGGFGGNGLEEH